MPSPDLLKRLRRAVQSTGLTAEQTNLAGDEYAIVVTNRLAQTTVRYLTHNVDSAAGQMLTEELRSLGNPEEYKLLMEERGFTFFHVVQYLYEYAKAHANVPNPDLFCLGVGRGGAGIEVKPNIEVMSLVRLLVSALPPGDDHLQLGPLVKELGAMMLGQLFPRDLFTIVMAPDGDRALRISFQYTDREMVERHHRPLGLEGDVGSFFLNEVLHIQGAIELGLSVFARDARRTVTMTDLVEDRDEVERRQIATTCQCEWRVSWRPEVKLRRIEDGETVMELARAVYETLGRKDLEFYLERIKSLEMQVRNLTTGGRGDLIGDSEAMRRVYDTIDRVADSDLTVLIRGESGTGKELVARVIHDASPRRDKPFVAVNCAAFSETLLESELFGHEKGAFTGADKLKPGRFELADGGTLMLDEVGDLPMTTQVKLLRALETQAFERVGGTQTIQTDVRIIGATNRDLESLIAKGEFREDFYFRLHVLPLEVPPLREHPDDIPLLAQSFLERAAERSGKDVHGFSRRAMELLVEHRWPGNVRELQHAVERAVVVYSRGTSLTEADVRQSLGIREPAPKVMPLNLRQREVVAAVQAGASTVKEVLGTIAASESGGDGRSQRTLQNDLKHLVELEYLAFYKEGNVRHYELTERGRAAGEAISD